ncbi:hypothetical protein [Kribbella sp.]|uniref:hypothetical protein n=1 Tax=Kribbella sp. TaxID=1871183 RepID=UPI002D4FD1AB|nr:hypothetical protein [Kribbella sp.]HZX04661.1 hypothetical protein [Kribbella sp.]
MGAQITAAPWVRQLVIDTGRAARRGHAIHGLFEVDGAPAARFVRRPRELLVAGDGIHPCSTAKEPV